MYTTRTPTSRGLLLLLKQKLEACQGRSALSMRAHTYSLCTLVQLVKLMYLLPPEKTLDGTPPVRGRGGPTPKEIRDQK